MKTSSCRINIGRLHPLGAILGGELAQSRLGLPNAINGVFQDMLLFFLLACDTLIDYRLVRNK